MQFSSTKYVIAENFTSFIINPVSIIIILVLIFCIAFLCMLDISAAIFTFEISRQGKRTNLKDIIKNSFKRSIRIFKPKNLCIIPLIIIFFPLLNIGATSIVTQNFNASTYFIDILKSNLLTLIVFTIILIAII